jgi:hypothetical protein
VFYALKHPKDIATLKKKMRGGKEIPFMGILRPKCLNVPHLFKPKNVN